MRIRAYIAAGVTGVAVALGVLVAWWFGHWSYVDVFQTIETFVEIAILVFVVLEGIKVGEQVREIHDSTATTVGTTDALQVAARSTCKFRKRVSRVPSGPTVKIFT